MSDGWILGLRKLYMLCSLRITCESNVQEDKKLKDQFKFIKKIQINEH